jgi:hypothetical protein
MAMLRHTPSHPEDLKLADEYPSLHLAFDLVQNRVSAQMEQARTLDAKANFALGSATALLGAALVMQAALVSIQSAKCVVPYLSPIITRAMMLLPLLIAYMVAIIIGFFAYKTRLYKLTPDPRELVETYVKKKIEEGQTKAALLSTTVKVFEDNEKQLLRKARFVDGSLLVLLAEALLLIPLLFLQGVC